MSTRSRAGDISQFAKQITGAQPNQVVKGVLKTSERVLKRITDGIYRQPSSALRELVSNAYDADATLVEIQTDPPRFDTIRVRDNGHGLSTEALAHLVYSIGGSAKRTVTGIATGDCSQEDRSRSPGGRKLIGKIGIGLFSVSQLTKEFQIITKTRGASHRTIADIVMHTHSEDVGDNPDADFATGSVEIWKVPAADLESHGTEVILRNLLDKTIEELRSAEMWNQCSPDSCPILDGSASAPRSPPNFHIGRVHPETPELFEVQPNLPWLETDPAPVRFEKLVHSMDELRATSKAIPSIVECLDAYLQMIWTLSLSVPLNYIGGHPFDLTPASGILFFTLGNQAKSAAEPLSMRKSESLRTKLSLRSPERGSAAAFTVLVDGVQLSRPLRFTGLPKSSTSISTPLLFVGKDAPDLSSIPEKIRGGNLEFEAYLFWNHTIVPKEHSGVLLRINDANGVLFDETFMKYPVSEVTRKRQITAEVFVMRGLDAALNIDRESFNFAHPHYQYLTRWVHNAFRQFASRQKSLAKEHLDRTRTEATTTQMSDLEQRVDRVVRRLQSDPDAPSTVVEFVDSTKDQHTKRKDGVLAFAKQDIFPVALVAKNKSGPLAHAQLRFEAQMKAVARILDAFDVFDNMTYQRQQQLLREIVAVFTDPVTEE